MRFGGFKCDVCCWHFNRIGEINPKTRDQPQKQVKFPQLQSFWFDSSDRAEIYLKKRSKKVEQLIDI